MRPSPVGIKLILLVAMALLPDYASFAAPSSSRVPTNKVEQTPASSTPNFYAPNTGDGAQEAKSPEARCNKLKGDSATCLAQEETFKRSAQAYSYLAFYMQNYSAFGKAMQDKDGLK